MSKYTAQTQNFILSQRNAMLATHSVANVGYPFGSIVPYDIDQNLRFIIYISYIAEHYRNLSANQHACLLICDAMGVNDPQQYARASVLLNFENIAEDERAQVQASYETRFPNSINYEIAHNFTFMRGQIERVRWIGGFGEIGWVSKEDLANSSFDSSAYNAFEIVTHMNEDHSDAISEMAHAFCPASRQHKNFRMTSISSEGFDIEWFESGNRRVERISFENRLQNPASARAEMIALTKKARAINSANKPS